MKRPKPCRFGLRMLAKVLLEFAHSRRAAAPVPGGTAVGPDHEQQVPSNPGSRKIDGALLRSSRYRCTSVKPSNLPIANPTRSPETKQERVRWRSTAVF